MGCIVRVHHPILTPEEREKREEEIKKALVEFYKDCMKTNQQDSIDNSPFLY